MPSGRLVGIDRIAPHSPHGARRVRTEPCARTTSIHRTDERRTALEDGEASDIERPHPSGTQLPRNARLGRQRPLLPRATRRYFAAGDTLRSGGPCTGACSTASATDPRS